MTKGERLIWGLFEMVREVMPATAANTERFNEWAATFRELEGHPAAAAAPAEAEPIADVAEAEDLPDEPARRKKR